MRQACDNWQDQPEYYFIWSPTLLSDPIESVRRDASISTFASFLQQQLDAVITIFHLPISQLSDIATNHQPHSVIQILQYNKPPLFTTRLHITQLFAALDVSMSFQRIYFCVFYKYITRIILSRKGPQCVCPSNYTRQKIYQ